MSAKKYIIDGNCEQVREEMRKYKTEDIFVYQWRDRIYEDIRELYDILLEEKEYMALKDFNECQFLIEYAVGNVKNRKHYPVYMQVEHTSYCNARCIMCSHYYMGNQGAFHMSENIFQKIEKYLPYVRRVGLHGYGEPFMAKGFLEHLERYQRYGVKFFVNTNLSILPEGMEKFYSDFEFINISCDGTTKEVFEGIRKNLKFEDFIANVKKLRAQAENVRLVLAVVLMRQNLHQCREFIEMAAELGVDEVTFSKVGINYVIGNYEDAVENYPQTLYKNLKEAIEAGEKLGVKVAAPLDKSVLDKVIDEETLLEEAKRMRDLPFWTYTSEEVYKKLETMKFYDIPLQLPLDEKCFQPTGVSVKGVCDWLLEDIYISAEGKIAFCCSNARYYVGDLNRQSIDEVWKGENYQRMIGMFKKGCLPDYCKYCNHLAKQLLKYVKCDTEELLRLRK
ncbi:MAG: radical SAM protein [Schaedlerella sp.]|nr:radical SAM protein [Schaedlerella sp.]